ncbi:flavin-nucleotide-binding protein [Arthrobacter sp. ERGS1:01]|uniref:pyridoxamine 5'-phosphate oxidase family protein n=1 Tax=Arthrobacter sp. ERGS1:01 TaxID=1704044 RepID=UPI0006B4E1D2|nr:pyridoxamine 5'-phosphate oxidase family protein [Arthrobacter sp. ERGS1:01]ALE05638.1 flavin-nucleotide-binding protein [Arthrobacter sp. ERGS1:01]
MTSKPAPAVTTALKPDECWKLLRTVSVGRLAVWVMDHPDIFPINFTTDHGTLVFRTGEGTKLASALGDTPVAMEADGVDANSGIAWSVVAKGSATAILATDDVLGTIGLPLFPWEAGHKDHFIRITPTSITGRRFVVTEPSTWWGSLDSAPHTASE